MQAAYGIRSKMSRQEAPEAWTLAARTPPTRRNLSRRSPCSFPLDALPPL